MKIKKVTFTELKRVMFRDEVILKQRYILKGEIEEDLDAWIKEIKNEYKSIKNLSHLNNYLQEQGFKEWEAYELIIGYLVKLPK